MEKVVFSTTSLKKLVCYLLMELNISSEPQLVTSHYDS